MSESKLVAARLEITEQGGGKVARNPAFDALEVEQRIFALEDWIDRLATLHSQLLGPQR